MSACGSDDSEPATEGTDPVIAEGFDIGDGRTLYLSCKGSGSPTILLETGDGGEPGAWSGIHDTLADETRTCAYDRAGRGRSSEATGCRDLDDILDDLDALLDVAEVDGPYVFVGASGGGHLAAGMAVRHPDEVAGLVLLDTFEAIMNPPPELEAELACDAPTNVERRDYIAVEHAAWDNREEIGDFPMVVITNDYGSTGTEDEQTNVVDQQGWLVLSSESKQVLVDSGHSVSRNEPELVVREILGVLG